MKNAGPSPALLLKLTVEDALTGRRILPACYGENYVSLLPDEARAITIDFPAGESKPDITVRGWNVDSETISVK